VIDTEAVRRVARSRTPQDIAELDAVLDLGDVDAADDPDWFSTRPRSPEDSAEHDADVATDAWQAITVVRDRRWDFRRRSSMDVKEWRALPARSSVRAGRRAPIHRTQAKKNRTCHSPGPRKSARPKAIATARAPTPEPPAPRTPAQKKPTKKRAPSPARFIAKSANRKLSPVRYEPAKLRPRPVPIGPFVAQTSVSIAATCSNSCAWKNNGCYAQTGFTGFAVRRLDDAAHGFTSAEVIHLEAQAIEQSFGGGMVPQDGARGGRDLRLHVTGDVGSSAGARRLGDAAEDYKARGGGSPWTFTEQWRKIRRGAWGPISVLASVAAPEEIEEARRAGYAAAIVVERFPSPKAFYLPGTTARLIPCPAEVTKKTTCVECRLCLDRDLLAMNAAIAFEAHGPGKKKVKQALVELRLPGARRGLPSTMGATYHG
jgi:hypothetical protein